MANTEGYYVKLTDDAVFDIEGYPVETPMEIPLSEGWNIISYPCENPQNALNTVQPLIDAGVLFKVIDETGGSIFHLPFPPPNGQWTNTIGNLQSGKGYYLRVTADAMLTITEPARAADPLPNPDNTNSTTYFQPVWENNPYMPMHIVLMPAEFMQAGDEIGVFDGEICVGSALFNGDYQNPIIICTSTKDKTPGTINGFIPGNPIICKLHGAGTEYFEAVSNLSTIIGNDVYEPLETYLAQIESITTVIAPNADLISQISIVPNPARDVTTLSFTLNIPCELKISIIDVFGQTARTINKSDFFEGKHDFRIKTDHLSTGTYFIKLETNLMESIPTIKKLIIY
jgi:hypothetical protein